MEVGRDSFLIWREFLLCKLWEAEPSQEHWQLLCENSPAALLLVPSKWFQILQQSYKIVMGGNLQKASFLLFNPGSVLLWSSSCHGRAIASSFTSFAFTDINNQRSMFPSISSFIQEKCSHVKCLPIIIFRFSSFSYSPEWFIIVISTVPTLWLSNYSLYCLLLLFVLL